MFAVAQRRRFGDLNHTLACAVNVVL